MIVSFNCVHFKQEKGTNNKLKLSESTLAKPC